MIRAAPDGSSERRVLVARPGAIGDTLLTYPALLRVHELFLGARVHLAGNPAAAPVLAAQHAPDGRPLLESWSDFDAAAVTGLLLPSGPSEHTKQAFEPLAAAVVWCADPAGVLAANLRRLGASRLVVAPSRPRLDAAVHVADHLLATLRSLDSTGEESGRLLPQQVGGAAAGPTPLLAVHPSWSEQANVALERLGLTDRPFVLVHPGSGSRTKNWPVERFARVVQQLPDTIGAVPVLLAGPADDEAAGHLLGMVSPPIGVLRDLPLTDVAALMRRARAYLGNDSGLTHLAGLLGAPTLALFGLTEPATWAPLGPRVRILRRQPLESLSAEDVLAELAGPLRSER